MLKLELRIVDTDQHMRSIAAVQSKPFDKDHLNSEKVFQDANNLLMSVVGYARTNVPDSDPQATSQGDKDASGYLRRFADLIDQGKYVLSVYKRKRGEKQEEIVLLLDDRKS